MDGLQIALGLGFADGVAELHERIGECLLVGLELPLVKTESLLLIGHDGVGLAGAVDAALDAADGGLLLGDNVAVVGDCLLSVVADGEVDHGVIVGQVGHVGLGAEDGGNQGVENGVDVALDVGNVAGKGLDGVLEDADLVRLDTGLLALALVIGAIAVVGGSVGEELTETAVGAIGNRSNEHRKNTSYDK